MKMLRRVVIDIETGQILDRVFENYLGPWAHCGGPSAEAKANENAQTNFYNTMVDEQSETFAQQQDILSQIQAVSAPILAAGPDQYGFTPAEDQALRSSVINNSAQQTQNAVNATELQQKQASGGTPVLPTGAGEEATLQAEELGGQNTANALSQEKLAGYQQGSTNYGQALAALTGNASLLSPTSYAGATSSAGSNATGAIKQADSERSNLLSSILGGVVGAGSSFLSGGLSNIVGGGGFLSPNT